MPPKCPPTQNPAHSIWPWAGKAQPNDSHLTCDTNQTPGLSASAVDGSYFTMDLITVVRLSQDTFFVSLALRFRILTTGEESNRHRNCHQDRTCAERLDKHEGASRATKPAAFHW